MRLIYNFAFIIFGIAYLPYFILRKRYRHGFRERCGFLPQKLISISSKHKIIWVHAVSVGEMKAASILAPLLRKSFPSHTLVFSSITPAGNNLARTIATGDEIAFYLPFDISFIVDRVVGIIKPSIFISLETELWPNLIYALHERGAQMILVNGRISHKSYARYKKVKFLIAPLLRKFSSMLMQSDKDAVRILTLGAPREKVFVTGNLKFDLNVFGIDARRKELREKLNISEDEILLIAGSTHKGEEEILIKCFLALRQDYENLRLLIAPRHIERTQEVEKLVLRYDCFSVRVSLVSNQQPSTNREPLTANRKPIFILDTMGDLKTMYAASDVVFVGKSLVNKGGQNPIEPASLAKPIITGKYTFNFHDVTRAFLDNDAAIKVENRGELYEALRFLLDNPKERKKLGLNAKETVTKNSGSSQRTVELIMSCIGKAA